MTDPLDVLRAAVSSRTPVSWTAITGAIAALSSTPSTDAEAVLVELLQLPSPPALAGGVVPHSQSPLDVIRAAAIDTLWRWTGTKYAAVCRQVAASSASPIVRRLVATRFPPGAPQG